MLKPYRIGQIVPSSNTTMETEIPAMLNARQAIRPERFTFHSSRMRMKQVRKEELAAMDGESDRCAIELSDAKVDVLGYACLVAIMAMGLGYHRNSEQRLRQATADNDANAPVITSAGALIEGLKVMGAKRIAIVAPYMKPLTELVVNYIRAEGFEVVDWRALEIPDNLEVARHDPANLPAIVAGMNLEGVDVIVLSACVQMQSLPVVAKVEAQTGKPVLTAAIATTYAMLKALDLEPIVPGAGALLSGAY
ncbi:MULTISPECIES: maleate cis-trans isomerase family protein [Pseudomonas]|uniref:Maleate isomerase n=4 Tax=Pseudomonas TaxID=286 RepID=A0AAN1CIM7_9PSED|nr:MULTISPECIES: Asp/Glu racemase [Pseudomonas]AKA80670.1 Maleate cis-trans isomerase [Pseudomonas synxantha]AMS21808.1 Asp/Glu racemase [Pseudomonas synxantha]AZE61014.1 Maleate cis-trans isomerase [Pseudomonas synxantha]AZE66986.1 Maleate cis-trans isomerase [Pseudomonas synxantha]AZE72823.1 Maleate cis-trans isomerase [Pseudomonas synxantha]